MKRTPTVEFYKAADGWRWRLRASNGRIVAQGEAHTSERDARRAFKTMAVAAAALAREKP
jgi:uncharacterized protein YegP (UPF0339 family)